MAEESDRGWDVPALLSELLAGELSGVPGWLEASWQEPLSFFRALHAHVMDSRPKPLKGRPAEGQDLYHDLVLRHLWERREAFVSFSVEAGWRRLSYDDLHARVTSLAAAWEEAGVQAGQTVALVLPLGEELVVTLLTALRLGLVFSLLLPRGAAFVKHRLGTLAPDHVVSRSHYAPLLGEWAPRQLPLPGSRGPAPEATLRSHTYAPEDVVARLFCPLSLTPEQPVELTADTLFRGLLRDTVLVLSLRADDRVAFPGFEPLQHQPHLLLATLLAGACFLEVDERALVDPEAAPLLAPTVLGISPEFRERILQGQVRVDSCRLWLRNAAEPLDWDRWDALATHFVERRCPGMNLVLNAAFGGSLLFSPPRMRPDFFAVLPAPGQPWQLAELLGSGQPSHEDNGLYCPLGEEALQEACGAFLLTRSRNSYLLAGSSRLGLHGQTYPVLEVVEVIEAHPAVRGASVVLSAAARPLQPTRVSLIVFVDPSRAPSQLAAELRPELEQRLDLEMGTRYRPHAMYFYPLTPRRTEAGGVDHDWCRWQFVSGTLDRKSQDELFRLLAHVRQLLDQSKA